MLVGKFYLIYLLLLDIVNLGHFQEIKDQTGKEIAEHNIILIQIQPHTLLVKVDVNIYVHSYSGTLTIQHPLGNEKQCWISRLLDYEVNLYEKLNGRCQRILADLGKRWFIEVPDLVGSTVCIHT